MRPRSKISLLAGIAILCCSMLSVLLPPSPVEAYQGDPSDALEALLNTGSPVTVAVQWSGSDFDAVRPTLGSIRTSTVLRTLPWASLEISGLEELEQLRGNPLITKVIPIPAARFSQTQGPTVTELMDNARPAVEVDQMHALGNRGQGVRIAIIDSGLEPHPAFTNRVVYERCILRNVSGLCGNGTNNYTGTGAASPDVTGHGTAVAGTIISDGISAPAGVAPRAVLEMFKIGGDGGAMSLMDATAAVELLNSHRTAVQVVNMSFGTFDTYPGTCSPVIFEPLAEAIADATARGVLFVAASGNDGETNESTFPACLASVVSATATVGSGTTLASYANISSDTEIAAPGNVTTTSAGGGTAAVGGTSFSSPIVAGCAALLIADGESDLPALRSRLTRSKRFATGGGHAAPYLTCAPECAGLAVSVNIAAGDTATTGNDVILGTPLADTINGFGGDDVVCAGGGDDEVNGGGGSDTIYGQSGNDNVTGGAGNDFIWGHSGNDTIHGNDGNDEIIGNAGNDVIFGGTGNDKLYGRDGSDRIFGDAGIDELYGEAGYDRLYGGPDGDYLSGGGQLDKMLGDGGDDTMVGDGDNDLMLGGDGNDTMLGAAGADEMYGQAGADHLTGNGGNDIMRGDDGPDTLIGSAGNDTIYGRAGDDKLYGRAGNDRLYGEAGTDVLFGEAGNDLLSGGADSDSCNGGSGTDSITTCP